MLANFNFPIFMINYDKTEKPKIKSGKLYPPELSFHIEALDIKQQHT